MDLELVLGGKAAQIEQVISIASRSASTAGSWKDCRERLPNSSRPSSGNAWPLRGLVIDTCFDRMFGRGFHEFCRNGRARCESQSDGKHPLPLPFAPRPPRAAEARDGHRLLFHDYANFELVSLHRPAAIPADRGAGDEPELGLCSHERTSPALRMTSGHALILSAILALGAACGEKSTEAKPTPTKAAAKPPSQLTRGRQVYVAHCAACHGLNLEGQPNWKQRLPNGKLPAPPHDETGHTWEHPDAVLFEVVKFGVAAKAGPNYPTDMLGFKDRLSDDEIVAVIQYIKSTWPERIRKKLEAHK